MSVLLLGGKWIFVINEADSAGTFSSSQMFALFPKSGLCIPSHCYVIWSTPLKQGILPYPSVGFINVTCWANGIWVEVAVYYYWPEAVRGWFCLFSSFLLSWEHVSSKDWSQSGTLKKIQGEPELIWSLELSGELPLNSETHK